MARALLLHINDGVINRHKQYETVEDAVAEIRRLRDERVERATAEEQKIELFSWKQEGMQGINIWSGGMTIGDSYVVITIT